MKTMTVALVVALMGIWSLANAGRIHACSCVTPGSPSEALANSKLVFAGTVVSVKEHEPPFGIRTMSSSDPTTVEFNTSVLWKGPMSHAFSLTTERSEASCGFTFVEGEKYLAYSRDGETVGLCSRTRLLREADTDLAELEYGIAAFGPMSETGPREVPGPAPRTEAPTETGPASGRPKAGMGCAASFNFGHIPGDMALLRLTAGLVWFGRRRRM